MRALRRWLKKEYYRCFYMRGQFLRTTFLLFIGAIVLLQLHTLTTSRHYDKGVDIEGHHFKSKHHRGNHGNEDDEDFIPHYVVQIGDPRQMKTFQIELERLMILNETAWLKLDSRLRNTHFLRMQTKGRLGNSMFAYASLLGIAKQNKMIPVLSEDSVLRKYFYISAKTDLSQSKEGQFSKSWPQYADSSFAKHNPKLSFLNYTMDIELKGYFQSWKYFWNIRKQVQQEFTFHPEVQTFAENLLQNLVYQTIGTETSLEFYTVVGIHIRRGDMVERHNAEKGFTVAPREYILTAIKYFEEKFDPAKLIFVVASDDMSWVRMNLRQQRALMVHSLFHDEIQDLALMSQCHHLVSTVGTFSWWAGFLSRGTVLYYKDFPLTGSSLEKSFSHEDYFPPHWVGIGRENFTV